MNDKMTIKQVSIILFGKVFNTRLGKIKEQSIILLNFEKIKFLFNYIPALSLPGFYLFWDNECYTIRFHLFFVFGIIFSKKKEPFIKPIILQIILQVLLLSFIFYKIIETL